MGPGRFACSQVMDGHLDAFMLNDAGALGNRWSWPGPSRDTWRVMETPGPAGAVAAVHYGTRHQVLAIAVGGTVYYSRWQEDPARWTGWSGFRPLPPLDGAITGLAFLPVWNGPVMLLALDATGRVRYCEWQREVGEDFQSQAWAGWSEFPGPPGNVTAIAADTVSADCQVFVAACDGNAWCRVWWRTQGRWTDWAPLPAPGFRVVEVACRSEGETRFETITTDQAGHRLGIWESRCTFEIVAIDDAGQAHRNYMVSESSSGPEPGGDWVTLPPAPSGTGTVAGVALSSDEDVAVVTPDGAIFRLRKYTSPSVYYEWAPWPVLPVAIQLFTSTAAQ